MIGAIRSQDARFSVTVPMNGSIRAAIAAIGEDAWTPIRYPRAIRGDRLQAWILFSPSRPAAMGHNLVRAAGALASLPFAKARAATIRRDLIAVAGRTARHGRGCLTLHLPQGWHREHEWLNLLTAACGPPAAVA